MREARRGGGRAVPATALQRVPLERRDIGADVAVRVDYCGADQPTCNAVRTPGRRTRSWTGHEFGVVTEVRPGRERVRVGDNRAVGNIVDSCGFMSHVPGGQENFCHRVPDVNDAGTDRHDG